MRWFSFNKAETGFPSSLLSSYGDLPEYQWRSYIILLAITLYAGEVVWGAEDGVDGEGGGVDGGGGGGGGGQPVEQELPLPIPRNIRKFLICILRAKQRVLIFVPKI